jgi:hypothetical protein
MTTPTKEPAEIWAGDSVSWLRSLPDYPAPTWTLTYTFRRGGSLVTVTAAASSSDHLATMTPADSSVLTPGTWDWAAQVSDGSDRYTVDEGQLSVRADLSNAAVDSRSFYQRALEAIEEVIEGKAEHDLTQFGIRSRSGSRLSWDELLSARRYFQDKVLEEKGKKPAAIMTRFR